MLNAKITTESMLNGCYAAELRRRKNDFFLWPIGIMATDGIYLLAIRFETMQRPREQLHHNCSNWLSTVRLRFPSKWNSGVAWRGVGSRVRLCNPQNQHQRLAHSLIYAFSLVGTLERMRHRAILNVPRSHIISSSMGQ